MSADRGKQRGRRRNTLRETDDITGRMPAEDAHRHGEALFRALTETAACAIFVYQGDIFRYVNPASEALTGYTKAELLQLRFWDIVHPEHRALIRERGMA